MDNTQWQEWIALAFFVICLWSYLHYSKRADISNRSLLTATDHYRLEWMREMMKRENRSIDAIMVGNITRSFTFFASTTMFILAALVSGLGYREKVNSILTDVPFAKLSDPAYWQMKILLLIIIFIYAFFKFTWSMRQYNYVSIYIGAAPDHRERLGEHEEIACRGAFLLSNAARHYNNGLRAYYYGLATLAWFIHPYFFMLATALVIYVTYRREYHSATLKNLMQ